MPLSGPVALVESWDHSTPFRNQCKHARGTGLPRNRSISAGSADMSDEKSNWVNVAWMPHSCLSQTSHLCLSVRSVLTLMEQHSAIEEWQVRVTVYGAAGLPLVPVATTTSTAPRLLIRDFWQSHEDGMFDKDAEWLPLVSNVSHICKFDSVIHIPIRWRDLPRDAYLLFVVLGYCDTVVSCVLCGGRKGNVSSI